MNKDNIHKLAIPEEAEDEHITELLKPEFKMDAMAAYLQPPAPVPTNQPNYAYYTFPPTHPHPPPLQHFPPPYYAPPPVQYPEPQYLHHQNSQI